VTPLSPSFPRVYLATATGFRSECKIPPPCNFFLPPLEPTFFLCRVNYIASIRAEPVIAPITIFFYCFLHNLRVRKICKSYKSEYIGYLFYKLSLSKLLHEIAYNTFISIFYYFQTVLYILSLDRYYMIFMRIYVKLLCNLHIICD